jgi:hypothetical protein
LSWRPVNVGDVPGDRFAFKLTRDPVRRSGYRSQRLVLWSLVLVLMAGGLSLVVGVPVVHAANGAETARLRAEGTEVDATVLDARDRSRVGAVIEVRYGVAGRQFQTLTRCQGGLQSCPPEGSTMRLFVDRNDPQRFVTDYGQLDNLRGGLRLVAALAFGVALTIFGIGGVWAMIPRRRR